MHVFVIESIQPLRKQESESFKLTYPFISKLIGLSLFFITTLYLSIVFTQGMPSLLVSFAILFMFSVGLFYGFRSINVNVDGKNKNVEVVRSFLFYTYFSTHIPFSDINDITYENRWMGQTVQPKYRLFIETSNDKIDIGIVNQTMKVNFILKKMWKIIDPEKVIEDSSESK